MKIDVLDKGHIELVDTLGDDLTPVNAARVSFGGRSDEFTTKDPLRKATLVSTPGVTHVSDPDKINGRKSRCLGSTLSSR